MGSLLHLQPQQMGFRTAHGRGLVSSLLVEGIAALIESVNLCLALILVVRVFGQAI